MPAERSGDSIVAMEPLSDGWKRLFVLGLGAADRPADLTRRKRVPPMEDRPLVIAGRTFRSRLILGTGKYRTMEDMIAAFDAADVDMVTVALRRLDLDDPTKKTI